MTHATCYSGEAFDPRTGLSYNRARYYNPAIGRFTRLDPFAGSVQNPLTLHRYLYAHANPVMGVDPTGMFFGGIIEFLGATTISLAKRGAHLASQAYTRAKAINATQYMFASANAVFTGWNNMYFGGRNLNGNIAFTIGFVGGFVEGIIAFKSPALAAGFSSAFIGTANQQFSNEPWSAGALAQILVDVAVSSGTAGLLSFADDLFNPDTSELTKFFIAINVGRWKTIGPELIKVLTE